ncbi:MAG: hypothetical protein ACYC27_06225 [Armatimonadota bacterium]
MVSSIRAITAIICLVVLAAVSPASVSAANGTAAILQANLPGEDADLISFLSDTIGSAGYRVIKIGAEKIIDPEFLTTDNFDLLVVSNSANLPARATDSIDAYLKSGGRIIALDAPMWQSSLINADGRWMTREKYQQEKAGTLPEHLLFSFTPGEVKNWNRTSDRLENKAVYEAVENGPVPGYGALHVLLSDQQGWDTFRSPDASNQFQPGDTLTVLSAKGDANTKQLSVEWGEKDGSRWIATINLSTEWKQYILTPDDFKYWASNPGRGFNGDKFKPENAMYMTIGLAFSHTGFTPGRHEYWVGPVGTAKMTVDMQEVLNAKNPPAIDTLSPAYKLFNSTQVANLKVRDDQAIANQINLTVPASISSPHPRPKGGGFDKGRTWRWIPLIEASAKNGEWRGTPAVMTVHADGMYRGGIWASFGIHGSDWYKLPSVQKLIGQVAERMNNGVYMIDGGSNCYTYFADQSMKLGMKVANVSRINRPGMRGRVTVTDAKTGKSVVTREWVLDLQPEDDVTVSDSWKPSSWPKDGFTVTAVILDGEKIIDKVIHTAYAWTPKKVKEFITVKNGDFMLNGKRWRAHGVNYMPSSGIATEDGNYFEDWIGARSYDPEVIERDIRHIKDMGMNSVSIFVYHGAIRAQNIIDILRRLDNHGIKANVSLRPGTPIDFPWAQIKDMIEYCRFKDNDTVFAYDLAWEPAFGNKVRNELDTEWEQWVVERYGSIKNAEKDWGYSIPRKNGIVTNPADEQLMNGPWIRMVAAYRRFLDCLLYSRYSEARRLVRSIDPNHFVSFRMSEAGNPTFNYTGMIPYDFPYLSAAVDILEPEAYGRIGHWDNVKPGWFQYEYARWAAPKKPMLWAEMGKSVWDMSVMESTQSELDFQANYYNDFYRMMISSGADGVYSWWYPGGFRYGENSDYGIINPDGSDRPVTVVIRQNASKFLAGPAAKPVDTWLEFDRDKHTIGIAGAYTELKDRFWAAIDKGRVPGLKTAGTGTDSSNCPLIAVGNTPYNGSNPLKYLDGAFDLVEVQTANGRWTPVVKGGSIGVRIDRPVVARVTLTNLGEAAWLTPKTTKTGGVYLMVNDARMTQPVIQEKIPYQGTVRFEKIVLAPVGLKAKKDISFSLKASNRASFGEKFSFTLLPE